jgi:hypothetical protein
MPRTKTQNIFISGPIRPPDLNSRLIHTIAHKKPETTEKRELLLLNEQVVCHELQKRDWTRFECLVAILSARL